MQSEMNNTRKQEHTVAGMPKQLSTMTSNSIRPSPGNQSNNTSIEVKRY